MNSLTLTLGRYDDPESQLQADYTIDLESHNLAIFGSSRSGKTSVLKMLIFQIHQVLRSIHATEEIYILDFGNRLANYEILPLVSGCFMAGNEENIRRMFKVIEDKYANNAKKLVGTSYQERGNRQVPHITFIIDGLNAMMEDDQFILYQDKLKMLARDGLSKGISIVFTANELTGSMRRLLPSFGRIIALDLPKDSYGELFSARVEKPIVCKGRGIVNNDTTHYEFQAYFPFDYTENTNETQNAMEKAEKEAIQTIRYWYALSGCDVSIAGADDTAMSLFKKLRANPEQDKIIVSNAALLKKRECTRLRSFTTELFRDSTWKNYTNQTWGDYVEKEHTEGNFTAGLNYYTFESVKLNLKEAQTIAIYGKKSFGKSNLLSLILDEVYKIPNSTVIMWDDGRKSLSDRAPDFMLRSRKQFSDCNRLIEVKSANELENLLRERNYLNIPTVESYFQTGFHQPIMPLQDTSHAPFDDDMAPPFPFDDDVIHPDLKDEHSSQIASIPSQEISGSPDPFITVVIQSRLFYQNSAMNEAVHIIPRLVSVLDAANVKMLFIFSDVQRFSSNELRIHFNNCIHHAFLLDDIHRFIKDKGSQSVFGNLDEAEMKERFGPCEIGDGFYLNIESEEIEKLKYLNAAHPEDFSKQTSQRT